MYIVFGSVLITNVIVFVFAKYYIVFILWGRRQSVICFNLYVYSVQLHCYSYRFSFHCTPTPELPE